MIAFGPDRQMVGLTSTGGLLFALRADGAVFVLRPDEHHWREAPPVPGSLRALESERATHAHLATRLP